jgi:hypothetical protein
MLRKLVLGLLSLLSPLVAAAASQTPAVFSSNSHDLLNSISSDGHPNNPRYGRGNPLRLGKHHVHTGPRSRFLAQTPTGNGSSIPAGGAVWPTAIYWALVQVGTPPQDFPVCIDSGSGDLDISGKGCDGCPTQAPNNQYDPASSSTSHKQLFPFSNSYQTCDLTNPTAVCTISGNTYKDQVSLAGFGPTTVKLGSINKQTSNFDQFKEIGGVMGFTGGGSEDVFGSLVNAGLCDNVWGMCMHEGSKSNGTLTIGGVDPRLSVDGDVSFVPDVGFGFHSVQVASLNLGGGDNSTAVSIKVNAAAILDTGTNILLLPTKVMSALEQNMCADSALAKCSDVWANGGANCQDLTEAQVDAYPNLTMSLGGGGTSLEMSSRDYLLQGSPLATSAGQYCLGIRDGGSAGGSGFIIGDTTMRNYYLVFDLAEKKIGWGKVNKEACGSV